MADNLSEILGGSIGEFTSLGVESQVPQAGYVERLEDGVIQLRLLDTDLLHPMPDDSTWLPPAVTGTTEHGETIVLHPTGRTTKVALGPKASNSYIRFQTIVGGVCQETSNLPKFVAANVFFPGISRWAGLRSHDETIDYDSSGYARSAVVELTKATEESEAIDKGRRICLSSHWEISGEERKTVSAAVRIGCEVRRPTNLTDLLIPLQRIQDFLNLTFNAYVTAVGGEVSLPENSDEGFPFWTRYIMNPPIGALERDVRSSPSTLLGEIGGLAGIRRWLRLYETHPRAVKGAVDRYRRGATSPEVSLMQAASALEYWVATHRRKKVKWAQSKPQAKAVALNVGHPFKEWIGDPEKWADIFWGAYNGLKHDVRYSPDPWDVRILAESGHLLLASALLKRISPSGAAISSFYKSRQSSRWQSAARELIEESPSSILR